MNSSILNRYVELVSRLNVRQNEIHVDLNGLAHALNCLRIVDYTSK